MATIAYDSSDERPARAPIAVHPAFPGIVALWFAALLGLGSLVLPPVLLERAVAATGLASLLPALAPPLGFTARALLGLAAALLGAGLGIAIARRVAAAHRPEPESRATKLAKRPISVHDELGGEGVINGHGLPINRRRALAISEDERPSDFLYLAPLPGEDPFPSTEVPAAEIAEDEPLELSDVAEDSPAEFAAPEQEAEEDPEMTDKQEFQPVSPFETFDETAAEPHAVQERDLRNNAAGPRGMEPLPFAAPSLARRAPQPSLEVTMELPEREPRQQFAPPAEPVAYEPEQPVEPAAEPVLEPAGEPLRGDWATAPTESLGLVQLVQRLGATIEKRREWVASAAAAAPAVPVPAPLGGVEAAPAEEAAQAMAAFFGSPAEPSAPIADITEQAGDEDISALETGPEEPAAPSLRPAFLRALPADEEDDDADDVPSFSLPLASAPASDNDEAAGEEAEHASEDAADAPNEDEGGYSSLLEMRNPFEAAEPEFVRIEEPEPAADEAEPAVVFPGQADMQPAAVIEPAAASRRFDPPGKPAPSSAAPSPISGDADAALRAALATLQRMSGAA